MAIPVVCTGCGHAPVEAMICCEDCNDILYYVCGSCTHTMYDEDGVFSGYHVYDDEDYDDEDYDDEIHDAWGEIPEEEEDV